MQQQQQQRNPAHSRGQSTVMSGAAPTSNTTKRTIASVDAGTALSSAEVLKQHKRRKPTERSLPVSLLSHDEGLLALNAEYEKLLELEKRLDMTFTRKQTELLEESATLKRTTHKVLRVRISNECKDQEWQISEQQQQAQQPDFESGAGVPSWTVKIEGKLQDLPGLPTSADPDLELLPKFSQLVQRVGIDIIRSSEGVYREPDVLNYSPNQSAPTDGFTFTRSGTSPVQIKLGLLVTQNPRRFKLAAPLSNVLGLKEDTKIGILTALWNYIQNERLLESSSSTGQPDVDRRNIRCDERLQKLFGAQKIPFYEMSTLVTRYLTNPDPVVLDYTVDVSPTCSETSTTYDILIELPDPSLRSSLEILKQLTPRNPSAASTPTSTPFSEIIKIDETITSRILNIRNLAYQHELFSQFSKNPVGFIKEWMESQSLDLDDMLDPAPAVLRNSGKTSVEALRDTEWFKQEWVGNAVGLYLARQQAVPQSK